LLDLPPPIQNLFTVRGWKPFDFQIRTWSAYLEGRSGLINAPTGVGKTWAAWMGPVIEAVREGPATQAIAKRGRGAPLGEPIRVLWITPLRALAGDTTAALAAPAEELQLPWTVQMRTGDTAQSIRRRQKERLPTALVTTPESLTLLLSYPDAREKFATLRCIVVDEWHELIGTKRGVQTELALARLRSFVPHLRTWGVSATLGNLEQAMRVLMPSASASEPTRPSHSSPPALIRGDLPKQLAIETLIPKDIERFPWAGHLGTRSVQEVIDAVRAANSTLLFTNTRSQAELWFRRITMEAPDLLGQVAIHHGSLDRSLRAKVEAMLDLGRLKCVVCTSSLDLGVDFAPVDQVLQVGSPKGIARLVQRAGRSGHRPGARSRVLGVPAHAFELIEFAAARDAAAEGRIESRPPIERALDVLVQHLVTMACAGGFVERELRHEIMSSHAYAGLTDREWDWAMEFVRQGGPALTAYPHFARVVFKDGRWIPPDDRSARLHRMGIGTITAETSMSVKYLSGRTLGHIEESFIARLPVGARFIFAGKVLELLRVREMSAYVQRARRKSGIVPRWDGGRFSLSTQLSAAVRRKLDAAREGLYDDAEMRAVRPLLELQRAVSVIPKPDELLIETIEVDRVHNVVLFPFQGRAAHEGMGALLAYRLSNRTPMTVTSVATDYGIGLRSDLPIILTEEDWHALLSTDNLLDDLAACLNMSNLARRQFRDIARIAGLIIPGFPGTKKPARHLQASSEMFFDVFEEFDPGNLLLDQARREVLQNQLEIVRLREALARSARQRMVLARPATLTPLSFPIWAEHLRATTLSSEKWADMVRRMVLRLEGQTEEDGGRTNGKGEFVNGHAGKHATKPSDRPGPGRRARVVLRRSTSSRRSIERGARGALGR
jgi:ATP-dependent Lhr-like helicase